jgi:hypothetical protein
MLQQRPGLAAIPQPLYKFMAGSAGRFPFSVFAAVLAAVAPILQQAALPQSTVRSRAQDAAQPASVAAVPMRAPITITFAFAFTRRSRRRGRYPLAFRAWFAC